MNFLKLSESKSAMSIASAGAIVLTITTTVCNSFGQLAAHGSYVALLLSLLISYSMINDLKKNFVNYIFMSLVVFHLAKGGNLTLSSTEDAFLHAKTVSAPSEMTLAPMPLKVSEMASNLEMPVMSVRAAAEIYPEAEPLAEPLVDSNSFYTSEIALAPVTLAPAPEYDTTEIPMFAPMATEGEGDKEGGKKIFRQW